jgi:phage internal scaffolding protein
MSNITPDKYRRRVYTPLSDKLVTEQSHKDECDINNIMAKYKMTAVINHNARFAPVYGDFCGIDSFQDAMNQIVLAQELFESVPSGIRAQFNNDPGAYLDFMLDHNNLAKIKEMGLPTDHLVTGPTGAAGAWSPEPATTPAGTPPDGATATV